MKLLTNTLHIPIWDKKDDKFEIISYTDYTITYCKSGKISKFMIVVNGIQTKNCINLLAPTNGWKKEILQSISDYKNDRNLVNKNVIVTKGISYHFLEQCYSKNIIKNIKSYLEDIKTEMSRDVLTKYELW